MFQQCPFTSVSFMPSISSVTFLIPHPTSSRHFFLSLSFCFLLLFLLDVLVCNTVTEDISHISLLSFHLQFLFRVIISKHYYWFLLCAICTPCPSLPLSLGIIITMVFLVLIYLRCVWSFYACLLSVSFHSPWYCSCLSMYMHVHTCMSIYAYSINVRFLFCINDI